jgi:hypothetical protein
MHFYFRYDGPDLGGLSSLRKHGLNSDIKHGQRGAGIVVAPPSRHEKDRSFAYAWDGCDETVIRELPKFNIKALEAILNKGIVVPTGTQAELKAKAGFKGESRELQLNSYLVGHGADLDAFELIALGQAWNERLPAEGIDKLEDHRVMHIGQTVSKDFQSGKLQCWHGRPSVARSTHDEVQDLLRRGKFGPFAVAMLLTLRTAHQARCERGETFAITPKPMALAGTLPGYTRETIEKCRDMLLDAGFIERVAPMINGKKRKAAAYRLKPRAI